MLRFLKDSLGLTAWTLFVAIVSLFIGLVWGIIGTENVLEGCNPDYEVNVLGLDNRKNGPAMSIRRKSKNK